MKHYINKLSCALLVCALALILVCAVPTNAKADVAPTGQVTNIQQIGASTTSVKLQWSACLDADGYDMEISYNNVDFVKKDYASGTNDTIYGLAAGTKYYVRVVPFNGYSWSNDRLKGQPSPSIAVYTQPNELKMVSDSVVLATSTPDSATINWTPVNGAVQYVIMKNSIEVARTTAPTYTFTGLTAGYSESYSVSAVSVNGPYSSIGSKEYVTVKTTSIDMPSGSLQQTGATSNSITLTWTPIAGATQYIVRGPNDIELARTADVTATIGGLFPSYSEIYSICAASGTTEGSKDYLTVKTAPSKVAQPAVGFLHGIKKMTFSLTSVPNATGYELKLYNNKIKKLGTYNISSGYDSFYVKNTYGGFYYKIRPYFVLANGTKVYGTTAAFSTIAPIDSVTIKGRTMSWKKITGASKYVIYRSKKKNKGFKKIGTVKKAKITSSKIVASKKYYYKIVSYVKLGKKTYKKTGIFQKKY